MRGPPRLSAEATCREQATGKPRRRLRVPWIKYDVCRLLISEMDTDIACPYPGLAGL